jgi:hypothetical protein
MSYNIVNTNNLNSLDNLSNPEEEYIDKNSSNSLLELNKKKVNRNIIKEITFKTLYYNNINKVTIDEIKLNEWRNVSEYIDILMNSYHDKEIIELDLREIVDFYSLIIIFDFFDTKKVPQVYFDKKQTIINGLAYFGVNSEIINSIKKGYGLVWKLCNIDNEMKNNESELKKLIYNNKTTEKDIENFDNISLDTDTTIFLKEQSIYEKCIENIDKELILNENTYNKLYEKLHENYKNICKMYETPNYIQNIYPEFDLLFIKQEFEKNSNNIFDNIHDCIVTGGMVSKHFTYNNYFVDTDYDVFLLTNDENRALEIINLIYNRLNSKLKTYILKTKNTITLYNSKFEIQIITKFYNNISEVFTNFDLDCCCVGYSNGVLYALPRFIRSLAYSGNIFDPEHQSPTYIYRLKKYEKRGFNIFIPGLNKNDTNYNKDNYIIKKLREKTSISQIKSEKKKVNDNFSDEHDYSYCDFFVFIKNRNNNEINILLDYFHKKGNFTDTFEIKNINQLNIKNDDYVKISWNINYNFFKNKKKEDFFKNMYNSIYIR